MLFRSTYILSEMAASHLKVTLTGDGGDELFAGYKKYFSLMENDAHSYSYFKDISLFHRGPALKDFCTEYFKSQIDERHPFQFYSDQLSQVSEMDSVNKALYFDTKQLLPGNNLVKPDKMAMAHSLETRSPFLDYRLFEYMFTVPGHLKLREKETKYILKKLAKKYLPDDLIYRKKQMFTVPVGEWFKRNLKSYLVGTLNSDLFKSRNFFDQKMVQYMLDMHLNDKQD